MTGNVKLNVYKEFFKAAHSHIYVVWVLIIFAASQFTYSTADYFLSQWYVTLVIFIHCSVAFMGHFFVSLSRADWEESILKVNPTILNEAVNVSAIDDSSTNHSEYIIDDRETYIIVYTAMIVIGTLCYTCHAFCFFQMCTRISINLHDMLYHGITRAKMFFFNNNPSGRILNRFSRDIETVDSTLPNTLVDVLDVSVNC